ncbi:signal recognition particle-docking protein FtsY [Seminavis robusta]|uniref:Signal recognition particle-docking protein FtsY n=1 Tax=Seminavis robusta TaxID=568900 RepID=A0A9N8EZP2_9STRA|nr:signal recognition particle-docking protein FtsY [Seminavis robusta]|eukprot:Sro2289_g322150.1 signal recognition particle-docking protein FtsY (732) ;mRNA; f:9342-11628
MRVVAGSTREMRQDGTFDVNSTVLEIGAKEIDEAYEAVQANGGTFIAPFVSNDLSEISDCLESSRAAEESTVSDFCKVVLETSTADTQVLLDCVDNPTSKQCQEILPGLLDASTRQSETQTSEQPEAELQEIADEGARNNEIMVDEVNAGTEGDDMQSVNDIPTAESLVEPPSRPQMTSADANAHSAIPSTGSPDSPSAVANPSTSYSSSNANPTTTAPAMRGPSVASGGSFNPTMSSGSEHPATKDKGMPVVAVPSLSTAPDASPVKESTSLAPGPNPTSTAAPFSGDHTVGGTAASHMVVTGTAGNAAPIASFSSSTPSRLSGTGTSAPSSLATPETTAEVTPQITFEPTSQPTPAPTFEHTPEPTNQPTPAPTTEPTAMPTPNPTTEPTLELNPTATESPSVATDFTLEPTTIVSPWPSLPPSPQCLSPFIDLVSSYQVSFDGDISEVPTDTLAEAFIQGYTGVPKDHCSPVLQSVTVEILSSSQRRLQDSNEVVFSASSTQPEVASLVSTESDKTAFLLSFNQHTSSSEIAMAIGIAASDQAPTSDMPIPSSPSESPTSTLPTLTPGSPSFAPTVTPGSPSASPTTAIPSVTPGSPSLTPTVTPGSPSANPTAAIPTVVPGSPSESPTSSLPMVTPGSPSFTPTITPGSPSSSPTTAILTVMPGSLSLTPTVTQDSPNANPTTAIPTVVPGSPSESPTSSLPTVMPGSPSFTPTVTLVQIQQQQFQL